MRICFITGYFDQYRGGGTVFADLFRSFAGRHEVTVLTREDRFPDRTWETKIVPVPIHHQLYWWGERRFARAAAAACIALHAQRPFDVIIVNQVIGMPIAAVRSTGIPVVYIIHHPVSVDMRLAQQETPGLVGRLVWRMRYGNLDRVQAKLTKQFQTVVTVSRATRDTIARDYRVPSEHISVIPNGIDTDFFRKTLPTEPRTAITVGSYQHPRRGFKYLLQVYRALSAQGWTLLDVGRRTESQERELKGIARVKVHGPVSREELRDLYSRASVMLSTSLYEGFGLSIAEAIACGTPAVAFAAGGNEDVLRAIELDLLCPPRDVRALVRKAIAYGTEPDPTRAARWRSIVEREYAVARMAEAYERLLQGLESSI